MSWSDWCAGVLNGIGAPNNATNTDTLYAWSNAETAPYDLMRWNNPLNTTEKYGTSFNSGAQPGPHDVQVYSSVQDGINATVLTLANGYYPIIVSHLRNSIPRQQWSDACAELKLWGTGCGWLNNAYGPAPSGVNDLTAEEHAALMEMLSDIRAMYPELRGGQETLTTEINDLKAAVAKLQQPSVTVPTQITMHIPAVPGDATGTLHP